MVKTNRWVVLSLVVLVSLLLGQFGLVAEAAAPEDIKVALLLPGSIGDAGWNANAYKGLQEIEAEGIETAYTESVPVRISKRRFADTRKKATR